MDNSIIAEYIQAGVRILSAMESVVRPFFDVDYMVNLRELWYHKDFKQLFSDAQQNLFTRVRPPRFSKSHKLISL